MKDWQGEVALPNFLHLYICNPTTHLHAIYRNVRELSAQQAVQVEFFSPLGTIAWRKAAGEFFRFRGLTLVFCLSRWLKYHW